MTGASIRYGHGRGYMVWEELPEGAIKLGDEIRCDRAMLLADKVLVRRNGIWIELRPIKWQETA